MKHKHYDLIIAYANKKQIQLLENDKWVDVTFPSFVDCLDYRIKPEVRLDRVHEALISLSFHAGPLLHPASPSEANIVLVFDGETGKLKQCTIKEA